MRKSIELGIALCCAAALAQAREEHKKDFLKTAPLPAGRSLRIDTSLGSVTIHTQAKAEATVHATIRCSGSTAEQARACADRIQISVDQNAGGISVRTVYPQNEGRSNLSFGVDFDIIMPETAPLDLRNRFGAVTVSGLKAAAEINNANGRVSLLGGRGQQRINNSFGEVEVRNIEGDAVIVNGNGAVTAVDVSGSLDITNRFGRIQATNTGKALTIRSNNSEIDVNRAGGVVTVANSFGRVTVADAGADVSVQNQNGEVSATSVTGAANLNNTFGRIRFSRIGKALAVRGQNSAVTGDTVGGSATVETSFGGVDLRDVKGGARVTGSNGEIRLNGVGGEAYAKTSFGGISVTDAAGPVTVESRNGSVTVEPRRGQQCHPIGISASFGPVRLALPAGLGYDLAASTSFGRIHSDHELTLAGETSKDSLAGKIAGGGCALKIANQNGSIDIVKPGLRM
jgi:hypothetical protein